MTGIKKSFQGDAVGNLYRSALFLAKGNVSLALFFLEKASKKLHIDQIVKNPDLLKSKKKQLYWAEKILDQYTFFKSKLLS